MPLVNVCVNHRLTLAEARQRVDGLRQAAGPALDGIWHDDGLDFQAEFCGMEAKGHLQLSVTTVRVVVDLPWLLVPLVAVVRERLTEGIRLHFADDLSA